MWIRLRLTGRDVDLYDRVADLLGPAGTPALEDLAEVIWHAAQDEVGENW